MSLYEYYIFHLFFQKLTALQGQRSDNFEILFLHRLLNLWEKRIRDRNIEFTDLDSSEFAVRQLVGLLRLKYHLVNTNFTEDISRDLFWPPSKTVARQMLIGLIIDYNNLKLIYWSIINPSLACLNYLIPYLGLDRRKYQTNMMDIWR